MSIVLLEFFVAIAINLLLFVPAYLLQSDKLTDLSYALSFIVLALLGFSQSSMQFVDFVALILVIAWALRLGTFLFIRILKNGKDQRFDEMRKNWFLFLRFWFFQGISVFIIILPGLLLWQSHTKVSVLIYFGIAVWLVGLIIEAMADYQKYNFKLKGSKTWIDEGVWSVSRHPNYLGEILVWVGFYLVCASALTGLSLLIVLVSPLYITLLLLKFSGVPLLEKSADQRWGKNKDYQQYKVAVPVLIPTFSSLKRLFNK